MERETGYIYSPLRTERRALFRRRQFLACVKILMQLPKLFGDYVFSSYHFENRPRNGWAYLKLFQLNLVAAVATLVGGVLLYEFSDHQLSHAMDRSAIFPLYFPHAIGLALACKYQGSVFMGNFLGFYFTRIYLVIRGPPTLDASRALIFILMGLFGVLETNIGAWLLHHYLCRQADALKKVPTIDNVSHAFFYISIVIGTTLVFDTLIAVVACVSEIVLWHNFARFWATSWLGVVAAMLTLSPAIIHLLAIRAPKLPLKLTSYWNLVKSILLWAVLVAILIMVFFFTIQTFVRPLPYLVFPLIIFASFRFNRVGWALVVAVISLCCAWGTVHRNSSLYYMAGAPADKASPSLILQIELFVSVMGLVGIVLAAAVKEKIQLTNDLNKMNEDLEETVATRTNELVKANNELIVSQKRAEHASHAKSDFLANMSHEIRTPIHGILGLTALLLESALTPDQRESLMSVKECADLLLHIINSVLDLSKIEAGRLEVETIPFSVRKMVSSTLRMMQARAQAHNLQLLWHIESGVPDRVVGDPGKLQQCLLNLVGNALKFTNEGSVTVRVSKFTRKIHQAPMTSLEREDAQAWTYRVVEVPPLFPRPPKPPSRLAKLRSWASWPGPHFKVDPEKSQSCTIDVHDSSDSDGFQNMSTKVAPVPDTEICSQPLTPETVEIEFEVHDTGIGISNEKLQDMFSPFTQADASTSRLYGGTGLGLCIVQRFVELLGGTIWAESEVNKGSTFGFRVPFRMSSDSEFIPKPETHRGPLRFSSLGAAIPSHPAAKNGLKRRAYSLDVLMRNMKFTLASLDEGNDGEESISCKTDSSGVDSRRSSLQRTGTQDSILTVLDPEDVTPAINESLHEENSERPVGLVPADRETPENSSVSSDFGDVRVTRLTIRTGPADPRSREGLPPSGRSDHKLHKFEKSYVRPKSTEEQRLKQPNLLIPPLENSSLAEEPDPSNHFTLINVDDRADGATGEQPVTNGVVEPPTLDPRPPPSDSQSAVPLPVEPPPEASAPPKQTRLMTSALAADSAKGFRKPSLEDGERPLHILLAEDNLINQKVASRQLQRHGHKVTIVNDGKLALEAVESNHEAYDLVLMDVQMPNMDGLKATEMIRDMESKRNWRRLPVLGLTAHAIQGYQETCLVHGMDGYLGKPFEIKQLLRLMQELLTSNNRGHGDHGWESGAPEN